MNFPKLKIGNLVPKYPIIQGGMAIRISMANLAAAVANEGGIGVIAGTALSVQELKDEIKKAREMTKGILGVNIMFAASNFVNLVRGAIDAGVDLVISGAGFSRDMFSIGKETNTPVVPIVSSLKLAKISQRLGAAAIIVEGANAGGHLGTEKDSWDIVEEIKRGVDIPVIAAGGVVTPEDVKRMLDLGLDGVQMGTRFLASKEIQIDQKYKQLILDSEDEDVITIMSSAGLPANAIRTEFSKKIVNGTVPKPKKCNNCLKHCTHTFCVNDALVEGHDGNFADGLFFSGRSVSKIKEILSVKEIFKRIVEYNE